MNSSRLGRTLHIQKTSQASINSHHSVNLDIATKQHETK